ncbi:MAG: hypothetical protein AB1758_08485 [Candidatus Eremiobacterota bacterium]
MEASLQTAEGYLRNALEQLSKAQEAALTRLGSKLTGTDKALFEDARKRYQAATRREIELKNEAGQKQSELTQTRSEIQVQEAKKTAAEGEIKDATAAKGSLERQRDAIVDDAKDSDSVKADKANRRAALQSQVDAAQARIDEANRRLTEATRALRRLREKETSLNDRINLINRTELPAQRRAAETAMKDMDSVQGGKGKTARALAQDPAVQEARRGVQQVERQLADLRQRLADIDSRLGRLKAELQRQKPPEPLQTPPDLRTGGGATNLGSGDTDDKKNCWEASAATARYNNTTGTDEHYKVLCLKDGADDTNHAVVVSQDGNWVMFDGTRALVPPVRLDDYLQRSGDGVTPRYQHFHRPDGARIGAVPPDVLLDPARAARALAPPTFDPVTRTFTGGELYGIPPSALFNDQTPGNGRKPLGPVVVPPGASEAQIAQAEADRLKLEQEFEKARKEADRAGLVPNPFDGLSPVTAQSFQLTYAMDRARAMMAGIVEIDLDGNNSPDGLTPDAVSDGGNRTSYTVGSADGPAQRYVLNLGDNGKIQEVRQNPDGSITYVIHQERPGLFSPHTTREITFRNAAMVEVNKYTSREWGEPGGRGNLIQSDRFIYDRNDPKRNRISVRETFYAESSQVVAYVYNSGIPAPNSTLQISAVVSPDQARAPFPIAGLTKANVMSSEPGSLYSGFLDFAPDGTAVLTTVEFQGTKKVVLAQGVGDPQLVQVQNQIYLRTRDLDPSQVTDETIRQIVEQFVFAQGWQQNPYRDAYYSFIARAFAAIGVDGVQAQTWIKEVVIQHYKAIFDSTSRLDPLARRPPTVSLQRFFDTLMENPSLVELSALGVASPSPMGGALQMNQGSLPFLWQAEKMANEPLFDGQSLNTILEGVQINGPDGRPLSREDVVATLMLGGQLAGKPKFMLNSTELATLETYKRLVESYPDLAAQMLAVYQTADHVTGQAFALSSNYMFMQRQYKAARELLAGTYDGARDSAGLFGRFGNDVVCPLTRTCTWDLDPRASTSSAHQNLQEWQAALEEYNRARYGYYTDGYPDMDRMNASIDRIYGTPERPGALFRTVGSPEALSSMKIEKGDYASQLQQFATVSAITGGALKGLAVGVIVAFSGGSGLPAIMLGGMANVVIGTIDREGRGDLGDIVWDFASGGIFTGAAALESAWIRSMQKAGVSWLTRTVIRAGLQAAVGFPLGVGEAWFRAGERDPGKLVLAGLQGAAFGAAFSLGSNFTAAGLKAGLLRMERYFGNVLSYLYPNARSRPTMDDLFRPRRIVAEKRSVNGIEYNSVDYAKYVVQGVDPERMVWPDIPGLSPVRAAEYRWYQNAYNEAIVLLRNGDAWSFVKKMQEVLQYAESKGIQVKPGKESVYESASKTIFLNASNFRQDPIRFGMVALEESWHMIEHQYNGGRPIPILAPVTVRPNGTNRAALAEYVRQELGGGDMQTGRTALMWVLEEEGFPGTFEDFLNARWNLISDPAVRARVIQIYDDALRIGRTIAGANEAQEISIRNLFWAYGVDPEVYYPGWLANHPERLENLP